MEKEGKAALFLLWLTWNIDIIGKCHQNKNTRDNKKSPIRKEFITSKLMIFSQ